MSKRAELSQATRALVEERVRSIEALETLMALHDDRDRALPEVELATRSRLPPDMVTAAIAELVAQRLATREGDAVRYAPESAELDARVGQLSVEYNSHRVEILVFISTGALNRVRRGALETFSEAFRLRGAKKDG